MPPAMAGWRFFFLSATLAAAKVKPLDWLHIPKTGGSFGYIVMLHNCDDIIVKNEYNASTLSDLFWTFNKDTPLLKGCQGLREADHGHHPLSGDSMFGHDDNKIERVVVMLRSSIDRIASGFMYHSHGCTEPVLEAMQQVNNKRTAFLEKFNGKPPTWVGWKMAEIACDWLSASNPVLRSRAEDAVLAYHNCQAGCANRMITGNHCPKVRLKSKHNHEDQYDRLVRAKETLERLAFVGLTGNWSQSTCLFSEMFPRSSGHPYPIWINTNQKPPPPGRKECEKLVQDVLTKHHVRDPDDDLYELGKVLLEKQLQTYPRCRNI